MSIPPKETPVKNTAYQPLLELFMGEDLNSQKQSLEALPESVKDRIFYYIHNLPGWRLKTIFRGVNVFDDLPKLQKAVQQVALTHLNEDEKISIAIVQICKQCGFNGLGSLGSPSTQILALLKPVAADQREEILDASAQFCKNFEINSLKSLTFLLRTIIDIRQGDRRAVVSATTRICNDFGINHEIAILSILRQVEKIGENQRKAVIDTTIQICKDFEIKNNIEISFALKEFAETASDEIENVATATTQICNEFGIRGWMRLFLIIKKVKNIPPDKRDGAIDMSLEFCRGFRIDKRPPSAWGPITIESESSWALTVLGQVAKTAPDKRMAVLNATVHICKELKIQSRDEMCSMLKEIVKTPAILKELKEIGASEEETIIATAIKICKEFPIAITLPWIPRTILGEVAKTTPSERREVFEATTSMRKELRIENPCSILKEILETAPKERREAIDATINICNQLRIRGSQNVIPLLQALKRVASGEKSEVVGEAALICNHLEISAAQGATVIIILALLPRPHRKIVTEPMRQYGLRNKNPDCFADFITYFLDQDPSLRQSWEEYLIARLTNETSPLIARMLAKMIWEKRRDLFLGDEEPLAEKALRILTTTEDLTNPKNPYAIYSKLDQARRASCIYILQPPKEIAHQVVRFNQNAFINQKACALRFKDLSPRINERTVQNLLDDFEQRIASLPQGDQDKLEHHIKASYAVELGSCKRSLRGNYVKTLLKKSENPEEEVSFQKAYFVAILEHILDQPIKIEVGNFFSLQEEGLLGLASSIQKCEAAQAEGIGLLYNELPIEYRYFQQKESGTPMAEKALAKLNPIVQRILNDQLSADNPMMRELTGATGPVEQLSHHSTFLKNALAQHIGLEHAIRFDEHTHTLYDQLLQRTVEELVTCFYKHLSVEAFVRGLKMAFNENQDLYPFLDCLLTEKYGEELDLGQTWELHDDDTQVWLTDTGAIQVWAAAGYLNQLETPNLNES